MSSGSAIPLHHSPASGTLSSEKTLDDSDHPSHTIDGLGLRSLSDVQRHNEGQDAVDPRLLEKGTLDARPSAEKLDERFAERLVRDVTHHPKRHDHDEKSDDTETAVHSSDEKQDVIYVTFEDDDQRNPMNFPRWLKWTITVIACTFTIYSSSNGATYGLGVDGMMRDLNCTQFQATIGIAVYCLGAGCVPLVTASFSEEFGRRPLYIVTCLGLLLMNMMTALAQNVTTVIMARLLGGACASTGATMVGGSIADIWRPHERGTPMSAFTLAAMAGIGIGPVAAGWIAEDPHLGWRWIQWFHVIGAGALLVAINIFMKETRGSIVLTRLAKKIRKKTGDARYRARAEDENADFKALLWVSCTRPCYLLISEPIVASCSLWVGFAWGILYCMVESIGPVFANLHNFSVGEQGTVFLAVLVGVVFGFFSTLHQESLYQKRVAKRGLEARLYWACVAGILFPIGMFVYAWTTFPSIPWVALCVGIVIIIWAIYIIYLAVFVYLADCYGMFASSSLAGQSLCRNLMGTAFPLFTQQMFDAMTYKWANTLFGCLAALMAPIPFILFFYGPSIRAHSKFSSKAMQTQ